MSMSEGGSKVEQEGLCSETITLKKTGDVTNEEIFRLDHVV